MEIPTIASYNPTEANPELCMGRRTEPDRRWSPLVFRAYQCTKKPVEGDLCQTCFRRSTNGSQEWCNRVTEDLPPDSHVAGSTWFLKKLDEGKLKFNGIPVGRDQTLEPAIKDSDALNETISHLEKELAEVKASCNFQNSLLVDIAYLVRPYDTDSNETMATSIKRIVERMIVAEAANQDLRNELADVKNDLYAAEANAVDRGCRLKELKEQREAILRALGIQTV